MTARESRPGQEGVPAPEQVGAFWDAQARTATAGGAAELSQLGTVTKERVAVSLRDELERAHLGRVLEVGAHSRVLDLGGGAGRIALWLAPRVAHVTLIDVSSELCEIARRAALQADIANFDARTASLLELEPSERYDAILIMGVLAHLEDDGVRKVAAFCARSLAPGGRLYLKEPVTTDGSTRLDEQSEGGIAYQVYFRPRERYPELLADDFRCVYQQPTCAHFFPWFVGGTDGAVAATRGTLASSAVRALTPALVRLDPWLQQLEDQTRANPWTEKLLATVPVLQDLYVMEPTTTTGRGARPAGSGAPELSVVVIAYNEQECLVPVLEELRAALEGRGVDFELVLVDDGSSDQTLAHMQSFAQADARARLVPLSPNRGIGGALRAGFDAATGRYVTWIPADGQIGPEIVLELYSLRARAPMTTTVYRSRDDAWYRHAISNTLNNLIKLKTGQVARSGGTYLFERRCWQDHAPREDDTMMISTAFRHALRAAGLVIDEIEVDARARVAGHSKVLNPRTIARTLAGLLKLR